jgi:hypothetical protein
MPIPDTNPSLTEKRTCIDSTSGHKETDVLSGGAQRLIEGPNGDLDTEASRQEETNS